MGKDPNEERNRRRSGSRRRQPRNIANWLEADGNALKRAIDAASSVGGALRFGLSRDGGAYAIGVYGDGDPYTEFISGSEDIDDTLNYYVDLFAMPLDPPDIENKSKKRP